VLPHLAGQYRAGPDLEEPSEDPADFRRALVVDNQLPILDAVAVGRDPAHPHAFPATGGDLVADALSRHLALELSEREQDVQRQPAHRRGRVEALRDGDESHAVPVEHLDQLGDPAPLEWTPLIGLGARRGVFDGEQEAASFS
jgi:hypothetical protein